MSSINDGFEKYNELQRKKSEQERMRKQSEIDRELKTPKKRC
jgi:hypothetical protein